VSPPLPFRASLPELPAGHAWVVTGHPVPVRVELLNQAGRVVADAVPSGSWSIHGRAVGGVNGAKVAHAAARVNALLPLVVQAAALLREAAEAAGYGMDDEWKKARGPSLF
jgi:hypothetical protein